jgi:hypothetical protein
MPLPEFQAALARVLSDEPLRQQFVRKGKDDPMPAELHAYGLSEHEWRQLVAVRTDRLSLYAHLLRDKRISKLPDTIPWTWFLLHDSLDSLVPEYCRAHLPASIRKLDEARSFYNFLLGRGSVQPPYVTEVARYEIVIRSLAEQRKFQTPRDTVLEWPSGSGTTPLFRLLAVARNQGIELLEFDYNMEQILPYLDQQRVPPEVSPSKTPILFATLPGQQPRGYVLSGGAAALLDLCDGRRSIRSVVDRSVASHVRNAEDRQMLEAACLQGLKTFVDNGITSLCPAERP